MYKVLLIDDEELVLESLQSSVDWRRFGFEVVAGKQNGIDALAYLDRHPVDLVFTDIRMPGLSGLELIKKANGLPQAPLFAVISGFAEFIYVQKALHYGAIGYCLKPFEEDEIAGILSKARSRLESRESTVDSALLLYENTDEENLRYLSKRIDTSDLVVAVSLGTQPLPLAERGIRAVSVKLGKEKTAYFLPARSALQASWPHIAGERSGIRGVGISRVKEGRTLLQAIESADTMAHQHFFAEDKTVFAETEFKDRLFYEAMNQLMGAMNRHDLAKAKECLAQIKRHFAAGEFHIKHAGILFNYILLTVNAPDPSLDSEDLLDDCFQIPHKFRNMHDFFENLDAHLESGSHDVPMTQNATLKPILQYVSQNFNKVLSIQSIADMFYTNPSYISQLFRKELNQTFTEYMTAKRMKHAQELLENTDLSMVEIAESAGYQDYFYFGKIFKKWFGKSPKAFRQENH